MPFFSQCSPRGAHEKIPPRRQSLAHLHWHWIVSPHHCRLRPLSDRPDSSAPRTLPRSPHDLDVSPICTSFFVFRRARLGLVFGRENLARTKNDAPHGSREIFIEQRLISRSLIVFRQFAFESHDEIDDIVLRLAFSKPRRNRSRCIEMESIHRARSFCTFWFEPP